MYDDDDEGKKAEGMKRTKIFWHVTSHVHRFHIHVISLQPTLSPYGRNNEDASVGA